MSVASKAQDEAGSFAEYATARYPALQRFAYLVCRDPVLSQDVVQEALARTFARWSSVRRRDDPDVYVRQVIVHLVVSWRRRLSWRREVTVSNPPELNTHADPGDAHTDRDEMWSLLATLPPRQRVVLVLRFYEDADDQTIARIIGCSPATVRSHASRGLARLRTTINSRLQETADGRR